MKLSSLLVRTRPQTRVWPLEELFDLVDYAEQLFQCGVGPLRVAPADAHLGLPGRVHRDLDPGGPAARVHGLGPAADEHLRLKAHNLLLERLQIGGLYLDVRA